MRKLIPYFFLLGFSIPVYANEGFIHHQIKNNTSYDLYIAVRQQFSFPIDGCLGVIPAHSEKECDGVFEIGYANFMIDVIKNTVTREELRAFANFRNYVQNPSFMVIWNIQLDESQALSATYQAKNF